MPLSAIRPDGSHLLSFLAADEEWDAIRASRGGHGLTMPDGAPAVVKVSKLGTRFFAHKPGYGAQTASESREHLEAKAIAATAAHAAGWEVTTEACGTAPDGREWRADVLCVRGSARIAVEVQWSSQTEEVMLSRQAVYTASGVRGLWLVRLVGRTRQSNRPSLPYTDRDCPAFGIRERDGIGFEVVFGGRCKGDRAIPLEAFVRGCLGGRLRWWSYDDWAARGFMPFALKAAETECWKCGEPLTFAYTLESVTDGMSYAFGLDTLSGLSSLRREIARLDGSRSSEIPSITEVASRLSKTTGSHTVVGVCPKCKASQGPGHMLGAMPYDHAMHSAMVHLDSADVPLGYYRDSGVWAWGMGDFPARTGLEPITM